MLNRFFPIFICAFLGMLQPLGLSAFAMDKSNAALSIELPDGQIVTISQTQLDEMDQVEFKTSTIWTDAEVSFSGVPLEAILEFAGAKGSSLELVALNNYSIEIPIAELEDQMPIVATRLDGAFMSVRDKGPFWLVYNYDSDKKFQTEVIYSRSIWQLNRLVVAP